uniref:Neur_chan_LBD domain-containing protein n=1 Tax=Macrostomum lignano TaxID=282301 RepID=A0A1I8GED9_9PLAT
MTTQLSLVLALVTWTQLPLVIGHSDVPLPKLRSHTFSTAANRSNEKLLIEMLVDRYRSTGLRGRPVFNASDTVSVAFGLAIIQILDLDENRQFLRTNCWQRYSWTDPLLEWDSWNNTNFQNITQLRLYPELVWTPDIRLFNFADTRLKEHRMARVVVYSSGSVLWVPQSLFKSTCPVEIEYFPFDTQTCDLEFGSWTYDVTQINLTWFGFEQTVIDGVLLVARCGYCACQSCPPDHLSSHLLRKAVQNFSSRRGLEAADTLQGFPWELASPVRASLQRKAGPKIHRSGPEIKELPTESAQHYWKVINLQLHITMHATGVQWLSISDYVCLSDPQLAHSLDPVAALYASLALWACPVSLPSEVRSDPLVRGWRHGKSKPRIPRAASLSRRPVKYRQSSHRQYNKYEPNVYEPNPYIDFTNYIKSPEWITDGQDDFRIRPSERRRQIRSRMECKNITFKGPDGRSHSQVFQRLVFKIRIHRNPDFYLSILVLPCILMSCLTWVIFWLPPESPAKMLLGMNIFVAFFILMILLAKTTPSAVALFLRSATSMGSTW